MSKSEMGRRVYIGELPENTDETDIKKALRRYGSLESVWVHGKGTYAFATFAERRDAEDAVKENPKVNGRRARMEIARNERRAQGGRGGGGGNDRCYSCGRPGHFAYECPDRAGGGRGRGGGGGRGRSRSRSDSRDRSRSRERDRSRSRSPRRR